MICSSFLFFNGATSASDVSQALSIVDGKKLIIQISSDSENPVFTMKISGRVDGNVDSYNDLALINYQTNASATSATAVDTYYVNVEGLLDVKASFTALTSGTIRVFGRLSK